MSSLYRALVVVTVVGSLGTLAFIQVTASAADVKAKKAVMARRPVAARPVPPAKGPLPPVADFDNGTDSQFAEGLTLPTDHSKKRALDAAQELMEEENWDAAIDVLNDLLDHSKEDVFIEVRHKDGKGSDPISLRVKANELLGSMPAEGLEEYEVKCGGRAKSLLADAKKDNDRKLLAEVALKYQHTEAGAEAANLLGTYYLDRGEYVTADRCFAQLLGHHTADKLKPITLLKAALAFRRADDKGNAQKAWEMLSKKLSREELRIGDEAASLDQLQQILDRASPTTQLARNDVPYWGGNPSRSAQYTGGTPYLVTQWDQPTIRESQTKTWVEQGVQARERLGQPVVPAFFPVAATVQSDTGPMPLLIYRSYWGVHAVELRTGKLYWESVLPQGMDFLVKDSQKMGVLNQWWNFYQQLNSQSILFENSTLGMISTDGTSVYAVDDLALPPHPNWLQQFQWGGGPQFGPLESAVKQSKLVAVELDSGKLLWEQGGPDGDQELAESFFLGPPLPLGGKLYVLNEKRTELRLLCLDPRRKGAVSWSQTLANIRDGLDKDVSRRMSAANLAYGEGILVCPTNAGAILGVDVLTHSLVWAQPYRKPNGSAPDPNNMGMIRRWGGNPYAGQPLSPDWKVTAPVIQDGKVVLAAPDGHAVECLNLRTGTPLWTANKLDDVYVGGVYNGKVLLVGKGACRALSLADGKQLWREQTGLPSGQGVASNNVYYLPLKSGITSKLPEVCAIDVNTGHIIGHSKSRPDHDGKRPVPGNLLFFEGDVLSQSVDTVTAYQQLQVKLDQITERLKANPTDPVGLTERGEMKLDKGDLEGAAADLHTALANKPPAEVLPKTRSKLFDTLTELLKKDFDKNEQYLKEYEGLCKVPIPPDVEEADKQKLVEEEQQRMANFLGLTAKGREKQGKLVEAFDAYMKFGSLGGNRELVPSVDDATIKARPDVWAQGRIAAMIAKATPQQRQPLEDQINEQWKKVRMAKGTDELRRFVSVFGTHFRVGKEAQLRLAERRMDEQGGFLEAEMLLLQLRRQGEPALAGQAVDALARLMIRKELMDDAAWYYRILARDFAHTVVRDGKTGADIYNDLATDKRFLPYLDDPQQAWIGGKMKAKEITGTFPQQWQMFNFEPEGDVLPFFQRNQLSLVNNSQVKLTDSHTGEERFLSQNLNNVNTQYLYNNGYPSARFPYQVEGHLLVLNLGHMVYAFDPIDKKLLWERNLFGSGAPNPNQGQQVIPDRDGGLEVVYPEGFRMRLGKPGPVRASYVCLLTRQGLEARDPISGTVLWTKTNTSPRSQIFGDEEHVYLLEGRDNNETVGAGQALRARDGATVENVPDFSNPWQHRIRTLGSKLLVSETDPEAGLVLRLYDVYTGKDVWKRTFSAKARVIRTEDDELTGVVEPDKDGKVTVIDLHTRKEVLVTRIDPAKLEKVAEDGVHLLRDNDHYYLTINAPFDPAANPWGGPWSNLNTGMRTVQVNGMVYAYHRATGKLNWYTDCPNQMLVLEHFAEMPILLFTSRYQKPIKDGAMIRGAVQVTATRSIDKRTGKLVYDKENNNNNGQQQFYAVNTDPKAGTIELVSYNFKIQHYMDTSASGSRRGPRGGVEKTSEQPVQERGTRGAIILNARDKLKE